MGDFNGDQKLDILAVDPGSSMPPSPAGDLTFYAGNGDGTFQSPITVSLPPSFPAALAAADFNADGKIDLLIGYPNMAAIASGNGDGTFLTGIGNLVQVYSIPPIGPSQGAIFAQTADFNMDGKPDAVVADYYNGILTVMLNDGIGKTVPPAGTTFTFNIAPGLADIAVGDLNGDGLPDIVVSNALTNTISIILSQRH